jgi:hypothetical protein
MRKREREEAISCQSILNDSGSYNLFDRITFVTVLTIYRLFKDRSHFEFGVLSSKEFAVTKGEPEVIGKKSEFANERLTRDFFAYRFSSARSSISNAKPVQSTFLLLVHNYQSFFDKSLLDFDSADVVSLH